MADGHDVDGLRALIDALGDPTRAEGLLLGLFRDSMDAAADTADDETRRLVMIGLALGAYLGLRMRAIEIELADERVKRDARYAAWLDTQTTEEAQ